jgi:hypothetical protein
MINCTLIQGFILVFFDFTYNFKILQILTSLTIIQTKFIVKIHDMSIENYEYYEKQG